MELICEIKTETRIHVDYYDLEDFIFEVYNQEYNIPYNEELPNGYILKYNLSKGKQREINKLEQFKKGKEVKYCLSTILQDLVDNDYIIEGDYQINVSW